MKKRIVIRIFIIIIALIILYLIYYFPLQRILAEVRFNKYINLQGIDPINIKSKEIFKNYKQDGYYIMIEYKDNEGFEYEYKYYFMNTHSFRIRDEMHLYIYKDGKELYPDYLGVKYPPLEYSS